MSNKRKASHVGTDEQTTINETPKRRTVTCGSCKQQGHTIRSHKCPNFEKRETLEEATGNDSKPTSSTTLSSLPQDAALCILQYFKTYQLVNLASLCRSLREAVELEARRRCPHEIRNDKPVGQSWIAFLCYNVNICADDDERITKTIAMADYKLNEKDLSNLDVKLARNPHYRNAAPMRLYLKRAVQIASFEKYGPGGLQNLQEASARKSALRTQRRESLCQTRTEELKSALAANGLSLRSDSAVCSAFIRGSKQHDLRQTVTLMKKAHILHEHTDYRTLLNTAYEEALDDFTYGEYQMDGMGYKSDAEGQALWSYFRNLIESTLSPTSPSKCAACGEVQVSRSLPTGIRNLSLHTFKFPIAVKLLRDGLTPEQRAIVEKEDDTQERFYVRAVDIAKLIFNMTTDEKLRLRMVVSDDALGYVNGVTDSIEVAKSLLQPIVDHEIAENTRKANIGTNKEKMLLQFAPYSWGFQRMENNQYKEELLKDLESGSWDHDCWESRISLSCKEKLGYERPVKRTLVGDERGEYLDQTLMDFLSTTEKSLETEPLNNAERKWIHCRCALMKLKHTTVRNGKETLLSVKVEK